LSLVSCLLPVTCCCGDSIIGQRQLTTILKPTILKPTK
jgi:hypothetical protein